MRLFVEQVIVGTTHVANKYSVNEQTNNNLNLTPSEDRNYPFLLAAQRRCFLEENKLPVKFVCFFWGIGATIRSPSSQSSRQNLNLNLPYFHGFQTSNDNIFCDAV